MEFTTIGFLPDDDTARQERPVATIAAPVFDHRGRVPMIVAVHPLQALSRRRINTVGRRVAQSTAAIDGR
jgi:DNA-binding IclR family transcriptional regulator